MINSTQESLLPSESTIMMICNVARQYAMIRRQKTAKHTSNIYCCMAGLS